MHGARSDHDAQFPGLRAAAFDKGRQIEIRVGAGGRNLDGGERGAGRSVPAQLTLHRGQYRTGPGEVGLDFGRNFPRRRRRGVGHRLEFSADLEQFTLGRFGRLSAIPDEPDPAQHRHGDQPEGEVKE